MKLTKKKKEIYIYHSFIHNSQIGIAIGDFVRVNPEVTLVAGNSGSQCHLS